VGQCEGTTLEEAEKRRAALEAMNPGSRYAVVAL
jgi:hypothetical protein